MTHGFSASGPGAPIPPPSRPTERAHPESGVCFEWCPSCARRIDKAACAAYDEFTGHAGSYARQSCGVQMIWQDIVRAALRAMQ